MFITEGAIITPEELHARLGPESLWVLLQYNPLLWSPAKRTGTPMLWLAGDSDVLISEPEERRSAAHYGADCVVVDGAGHNLMTERSYRQTEVSHFTPELPRSFRRYNSAGLWPQQTSWPGLALPGG